MPADTCRHGHLWAENEYIIPSSGKRRCRVCKLKVYDRIERQRTRERLGLPPADPHLGRYAVPR
jgi:hypothetical protein